MVSFARWALYPAAWAADTDLETGWFRTGALAIALGAKGWPVRDAYFTATVQGGISMTYRSGALALAACLPPASANNLYLCLARDFNASIGGQLLTLAVGCFGFSGAISGFPFVNLDSRVMRGLQVLLRESGHHRAIFTSFDASTASSSMAIASRPPASVTADRSCVTVCRADCDRQGGWHPDQQGQAGQQVQVVGQPRFDDSRSPGKGKVGQRHSARHANDP